MVLISSSRSLVSVHTFHNNMTASMSSCQCAWGFFLRIVRTGWYQSIHSHELQQRDYVSHASLVVTGKAAAKDMEGDQWPRPSQSQPLKKSRSPTLGEGQCGGELKSLSADESDMLTFAQVCQIFHVGSRISRGFFFQHPFLANGKVKLECIISKKAECLLTVCGVLLVN